MTGLDDREHVEGHKGEPTNRTHPLDEYRRGEFVHWRLDWRNLMGGTLRSWMVAGRVPDGRLCIRTKMEAGGVGAVLVPESDLEAT